MRRPLDGKRSPSLCAAPGNHCPPTWRQHTVSKAVDTEPSALLWLIRSFTHNLPDYRRPREGVSILARLNVCRCGERVVPPWHVVP